MRVFLRLITEALEDSAHLSDDPVADLVVSRPDFARALLAWLEAHGDVAAAAQVMDADGYLSIVGRSKDMVIRGGENVYPRLIEQFLYTHPDVLDAQVIGVPNARYGEELCAWVRLRDEPASMPRR